MDPGRAISISLLYLSHIFMANSTGSQPFIHLLNLKAIPNHSRHPVIHQIREMIGLASLAIFFQLLQNFLEGPDPALRWLPGWSISFSTEVVLCAIIGFYHYSQHKTCYEFGNEKEVCCYSIQGNTVLTFL